MSSRGHIEGCFRVRPIGFEKGQARGSTPYGVLFLHNGRYSYLKNNGLAYVGVDPRVHPFRNEDAQIKTSLASRAKLAIVLQDGGYFW